MKRHLGVIVLCVACGLAVLAQAPAAGAEDPNTTSQPSAVQDAGPVVVGKIGEYTITRDELKDKLVQDIRPREDDSLDDPAPVTAEATLRTMLADKAMSMEGRTLGYLKDEVIRSSIEQIEHQQLVRMVLENYVAQNLAINESEIDRLVKADPNMSREQAKSLIQRSVVPRMLDQFYTRLLEKFQLKKVEENFAQAAQIHQRLLLKPVESRSGGEYWIKNSQVRSELSDQEKALPLATYKGGQFTLEDWFKTLCNIVPPRRPTNLGTPAGVAQLLDRSLRTPIMVAEAKAQGYDKDPTLRSRIKEIEDNRLLYKTMEERTKGIKEPTEEEIKAAFEKHKERFAEGIVLKVDQIWCADRATAEKVKRLLTEGADFAAVKKEHSLRKDLEPHNLYPGGEGLFWADLWKGEPNDVVGPVKGFYDSGLRWRVVKILEKKPGTAPSYSEQTANRIKWAMMARERERLLDDYRKELLQKYPHEIYEDKIEGMDPLEIAMAQGND